MARKRVEDMRRDVPHSKEKEKRISVVLSSKAVLRLKRGIAVDDGMMEKRRSVSEMEDVIEKTSVEIKERLNAAKMHGMKWSNLENK